jgi:hypothetical protein
VVAQRCQNDRREEIPWEKVLAMGCAEHDDAYWNMKEIDPVTNAA